MASNSPEPASDFWRGRAVAVTGGTGFIGSFVVERLLGRGATVRVPTRDRARVDRFLAEHRDRLDVVETDLATRDGARRAVDGVEVVLHLAATVGGIEYNMGHPASIFANNLGAFMTTIEAARQAEVERFLVTSSACVYPRHCSIPTPESEAFTGRPEPTNEGYGWAKRMEEFLGEAYAREYGMKVAIARPYNCYGPRDNFDPASSHVIPALIRRIWRDRERPLRPWGSGRQSRSFLYVDDFARGLLEVAEKHPVAEPLNLGADEETTVAELVEHLAVIHEEISGERFEVEFDTSRPEGQPRRRCDTRRAREAIDWKARWRLADGLKETVRWYVEQGMP